MMLNRFKLSIRKKSPNAALANTYLLLLTLIIIINHHGTSSQSTQQRKPKSRVVVAAKDIPTTSFSCNEHSPGYYADVETGCQVYHMCSEGGTQFSYRCPNTTLFQQRMLICAHWYQVNCSRSEQHFNANLLIGQRDKPFIDESEQVNIYYHGKDLKNLLNPDDLQRLQQARQASSSSNGLQMSASEYPTPGAFNNFQRPRMENHFTDNFATQKSINEQNINHQQSGKPILQFPTSRTTLAPFQQHNQQNFYNQRSGKPVSQFPTSSTTFASFKQNNYNQNIQSLQPQQTVSTTAKANQFNQQRIVYTPSTTTAIPFQQNNFNQNFNSFQPQQIDTATVMPIQLNQQRISQKISTISTPVPFNIGTNPHTPSTQQSSFHTNNQHTVAHFTTQPQFHISTAPFTNQPQVSQNQMPQKFTSSPFQSTVNQHFQVENNLSNNNVGQVSSNSNFFPNTEKPATVVNEHTYNNFIRRFIPDVEESSKSASGGNRATNNINTTNEYNQFLKVFVPDTSPVQNVTTNSTDYNQFLKVFIPDDSTFTNTNNSYRQNSKLFTSNFVSEINSLSKDIEPPFVGLISDLSAPPFEDVDSDSVGSSLELFKLKIQDPRHAFFIPDNDNEQIPLDSQVTPITITIQRPGSSKPHPMTFLNSVSDNCYRCHPNFIVDKGACTPCVIIR